MQTRLLIMRFFTSLIMCCCFYLGISQSKSFSVDWTEPKPLSTTQVQIEIPSFQDENFSYSDSEGLKFFSVWTDQISVDENSVQVEAMEVQSISVSELKDLSPQTIPQGVQWSLKNMNSRGQKSVYFELSPIFFQDGRLKRVLSFTISYRTAIQARAFTTSPPNALTSSALKSGEWYRFAIDTTGVYKLSKSFLSSLGVNVNQLDPRTLKIYGHGGGALPLLNSDTVSNDLIENAIKVIGETDGVFDDSDHILMYGIGPKQFSSENNSHVNPYSDKAYYYVHISSGNGLRIVEATQPSATADQIFSTFHDYNFFEEDLFNIAKLGRRWMGPRFYSENTQSYSFNFPNRIPSSKIKLKVLAAAVAESNSSMEIKVNSVVVNNLSFNAIDYQTLASSDQYINDVELNSDTVTIDLIYDNNGNPSASAYLDYIAIEAERELRLVDQQFNFKHNDAETQIGVGAYQIENASSITEVWDITNPYNITTFNNSNQDSQFSFKTELGTKKLFQTVVESDYYSPTKTATTLIANQDIKGTVFLDNRGQFQDIDYLIITPRFLQSQAERLAQINRDVNNLNVKVYNLEEIYQEFSSGMQDISAIRNFIKYIYDNASSPQNRLQYLCLFGDASFDFKDRINNNTNIVPSWFSLSSFSLTSSFVSDDFFGMMDANEGLMQSSDQLDIAVGRILAETPQRARAMVDKVQAYYGEAAYGSWRNNFLMVSDDVDKFGDRLIQQTTDDIAETVKAEKPFLNVKKIHADSYLQEITSGGPRYSEVNKAIFDELEVGAVVVNYFGHGGEDGLAAERIFDKVNAQELNNRHKLNCFVTVTCEYTKFDNPLRASAGEFLFWNEKGGAISLITTTRQIFVGVGINFNKTLGQYLFSFGSDEKISIAEALRRTKTDPLISGVSQRRLVFYFGDPALQLPIADPKIKITKINGVDVANVTEPVQALSEARIEGVVTDNNENILTNYQGVVTAVIYDKDIERSTLGNDGVVNSATNQLIILDYSALGEVIFRGQASVTDGEFNFNFIVPKDINIPVGNGKISLYSTNQDISDDKRGYSYAIKIGGVNSNAPVDNTGPTINLYMNDENFVSGGITNEQPTLIANLFDESGINTASGIGHDIVAIIDGDETSPFILNDYYTATIDNYKSGSLSYPFRDLEPGPHTLTLKAWDVYNNSSTQDIQFVVFDEDQGLEITNVLNYPNPFVNYTEFWFNHNSSEVLDVSVQVFTISGKLVKTINGQTNNIGGRSSSVSRELYWDGTDDFGQKIGKGVYVYKLRVRSPLLNKEVEKIEKLVIL